MNPIPLLTENVSNLWYWTYGISTNKPVLINSYPPG